ncbi:hypothetical protein JB92DRAFT_2073139 [Gautieria morchelliformis]|nr:hypothetical protein JB92DRAFT_2073139 [Gautieria morchelliformis]
MDGEPLCVVCRICSALLYNIYSTLGLLVNFDVLSAVSVLALRLRRHGHTANSTIFVLAASVPVAYAALSIVGATLFSTILRTAISKLCRAERGPHCSRPSLQSAPSLSLLEDRPCEHTDCERVLLVSDRESGSRCGPIQIGPPGKIQIVL